VEKSKFDGKAIESLRELVEPHDQQERSQQPSSDVAKGDVAKGRGSSNPGEEEKRVP